MSTMIHTPESIALIEAYKALSVFTRSSGSAFDNGLRAYLEEVDPKSIKQADEAIETVRAALTSQQLVTILPSGTTVAVTTAMSREGEEIFGEVRDCAHGLFIYSQAMGQERRITTRGGWELMTNAHLPLTGLRVTTPEEHKAAH